MRVKILGAGSVGNHFAHAARHKGWQVWVCDPDADALDRMRTSLFPARYGAWDPAIQLCGPQNAPQGQFDLIVVGTPPDVHLEAARQALQEEPRILLIEKPLLPPVSSDIDDLAAQVQSSDARVLVGYNHLLSPALTRWETRLVEVGKPLSLDVAFREHWNGFFAAHPWLRGPADSYLGFTHRGGGAGGEHSHALSLWLHIAEAVNAGPVTSVRAFMDSVQEGGAEYDRIFKVHLETQKGLGGTVTQDVITWPAQKRARLQGDRGAYEVDFHGHVGEDQVVFTPLSGNPKVHHHPKTRPLEFIRELDHIEDLLENPLAPSPISVEHGLSVMRLLVAACQSAARGVTVAP
jgi:predicted dehydrogenase